MAARGSIGSFSFPSPRGCLSPSSLAGELTRLNRITSLLAGAVFVSLLGTAWLAHLAARRADVLPFVADGGVFGCAVRVLAAPPAPRGEREP
ncbi:hypothetical protein [Methylorubrum thiocyanatum]|uniref:hypothetical protein n=1 Tax=Methylorubrum thiocyanatum TaxID=47958 RepID=UPI003F8019EB